MNLIEFDHQGLNTEDAQMGKKSREFSKLPEVDPYDEYEYWEDEDFDLDQLAQDIQSTEWGSDLYVDERFSTRRKIERYEEMKKLREEFND